MIKTNNGLTLSSLLSDKNKSIRRNVYIVSTRLLCHNTSRFDKIRRTFRFNTLSGRMRKSQTSFSKTPNRLHCYVWLLIEIWVLAIQSLINRLYSTTYPRKYAYYRSNKCSYLFTLSIHDWLLMLTFAEQFKLRLYIIIKTVIRGFVAKVNRIR